ncbi:hypothetical protein ADIARSV_4077 [Arcticibacter svalbardensis MN12-7]|uniref:DUF1343 domain-containing protein n=1 Tax=Arcticibacter svalbardensis MN12-7 TaxID=1150600 RepID=R9GMN5_9SPHI|nr:DUF1343 domain-containing protein [Arcticibacter svalbardensis]EOR92795.1 hypothetical protein ADIARSV_4077 [Arcticibacter svalbardensis MN12-7]
MFKKEITLLLSAVLFVSVATAQICTGADQTEKYIPYLKGKRIGMVVNPTSIIDGKSSVDSLHKRGVNIVKVFGPEHGFRGDVGAGVHVGNSVDPATGIPVISLYGKNDKPTKEMLANIDLMIFDIQDVGARYYTYLATMHRVMEACAENGKELLILDRPNPNGYFVDGPVLDMKLKSGIGYHPVPIAHGMTVAEYAQMLNGEGWLANGIKCKIKIIPMTNYRHDTPYVLPVNPSPNLNTNQSILLYPSLCLFEGTIISQGRGTMFPFAVLGNPDLKGKYSFSFTPLAIKGMSETPLFKDVTCYGLDLRKYDVKKLRASKKVNLGWLIEMYKSYPYKDKFFDFTQSKQMGNFDKLAGTYDLKKQIVAGLSEEEIRKSWEPELSVFKKMREKYLLYK